jgi:hypothetical protein
MNMYWERDVLGSHFQKKSLYIWLIYTLPLPPPPELNRRTGGDMAGTEADRDIYMLIPKKNRLVYQISRTENWKI